MEHLLDIRDLSISYGERPEPAVRDFSLTVGSGEIVAVVGESGSGKTSVIRAVLGCLPGRGRVCSGEILFEGRSLLSNSAEEWRRLRGTEISMIFQDSGAMLDPIRRIGSQFAESVRAHRDIPADEAWDIGTEMLGRMRLPDPENVMNLYPFELSGGMRQRVGIAMAMTFGPKLLLADEPTSALDVSTQARIVRQMTDLRDKEGTAMIIVTHNLGVAADTADRIVVMRQGRIAESGAKDKILTDPSDPYTRHLIESVPSIGGPRYV